MKKKLIEVHIIFRSPIFIRLLGLLPYETSLRMMKEFTETRNEKTPDEFWIVEHPPVFTQGQAGKAEHLLNPGNIPVIQTDRGGQVTYHGPGQLVIYILINLKARGLTIRELVTQLEQSVIEYLAFYNIQAESRRDAPGVYVNGAKICALGLRIRRGYSYHGLSFNVNMDLSPFNRINPCGHKGLAITQLAALGGPKTLQEAAPGLIKSLAKTLKYEKIVYREVTFKNEDVITE